ncbi:DNA cytosine methyltransferase [Anaerolineales bacterium]
MAVSVIDLFCGVGGITHGFILEGFNVVAGVDIDISCKYPYEANNTGAVFYAMDLIEEPIENVERLFPKDDVRVLVGCAPCQPFSSNARAKRRNDDKWKLVPRFADIIEQIQPTIVSMENVTDLKNFNKGQILADFIRLLKYNKYHVWSDEIYCPDYGIPQTRKRLVLLASKLSEISMIDPTCSPDHYPTVESTIRDLPPLEAGETDESDPVHRARGLAPINLRRIQQSLPGGTWLDWDEELRADCHRKSSGSTYVNVYGRMIWEQPAPTITTQAHSYGSGRFGHPEQDRALSLREMALLQTFPPDYIFALPSETVTLDHTAVLIGNAVPVNLGKAIAESIKVHLEAHGYMVD